MVQFMILSPDLKNSLPVFKIKNQQLSAMSRLTLNQLLILSIEVQRVYLAMIQSISILNVLMGNLKMWLNKVNVSSLKVLSLKLFVRGLINSLQTNASASSSSIIQTMVSAKTIHSKERKRSKGHFLRKLSNN